MHVELRAFALSLEKKERCLVPSALIKAKNFRENPQLLLKTHRGGYLKVRGKTGQFNMSNP